MSMNNEAQPNYAPLWKKLTVAGAVTATIAGLGFAQNLTQVSVSAKSEYISVTEFAAGKTHATILSPDGKAYSRGWNNLGQLGVASGSKVNIKDWTPISVPEKLVSVKSTDHTVALSESGTIYTWGPNTNGQIGNGSNNTAFTPTQITAVDRYSKVASGASFTLALDAEGHLWSWGANNAGQLGDGTTENRSTPKMIIGDITFDEIYAAKETAYAIASDGSLWAWGSNSEGQMGDGTTNSRNKPAVVETSQRWSRLAVSLENNTVLGLDRSGWLYSWGSNANGLLGTGTDWRQLQADEDARFKAMIEEIEESDANRKDALITKCVNDAYSEALAKYDTEYGKLVRDSEAAKAAEEAKAKEEEAKKNTPSPSPSPSASASPTATASPSASATATPSATPSATATPIPNPNDLKKPVRDDFVEKCTTDVEKTFAKTDVSGMKAAVIKEPPLKEGVKTPQQVTNQYRVKDIAVGSENAYIVDAFNSLRSWGKDVNGQTGLGLEDEKSITQVPVVVQKSIADVDAGSKYGVAVASTGELYVWGSNTNGVLMSNPSSEAKLLKPTPKGSGYTTVTAGLTTVYGFKNETVYAWGNNTNGEVGVDAVENSVTSATKLPADLTSISPSAKGAVGLGTTNQFMFWGVNDSGQFGNNKTDSFALRTVSSNEITNFKAVSAGENYTLAIAPDGRVWGWGSNSTNLLKLTGTKDELYPVVLSVRLGAVNAIAAGKNVSAMADDKTLKIWANGISHSYDLADITELSAGNNHVLALTKDGKVWNWSSDGSGVREGTEPNTLVQVDERTYSSVAAGGTTSGAIMENGEAVIWGSEALRLAEKEGDPVGNLTFNNLSIGDGYVLASDKNLVLWGWGENRYLVLGNQSVNKFPAVLTSQVEKVNEVEEVK